MRGRSVVFCDGISSEQAHVSMCVLCAYTVCEVYTHQRGKLERITHMYTVWDEEGERAVSFTKETHCVPLLFLYSSTVSIFGSGVCQL